ncbi:hypothetical protein MesoLjLa_66300 (plasmid) [Mesorhizobium sp. L-2-11]|nr:hypothetical protein MesoLjLa_66300 [Mesorhizobium sp. L-2-11]
MSFSAATTATSIAVDRPEAIGPHPPGSPLRGRNGVVLRAGTIVKGSQGEAFLFRAE